MKSNGASVIQFLLILKYSFIFMRYTFMIIKLETYELSCGLKH